MVRFYVPQIYLGQDCQKTTVSQKVNKPFANDLGKIL